MGGGSLAVNHKYSGALPVTQISTPPRLAGESKQPSREGSSYNGPTVLGRGDSTILSSAALTEPIGRTEALDPILISHTLHCLTECSQDPVSRSTSSNMGGRRAEIISPTGAFEQLRCTLRSINPGDPTLAAFDSTRVKGAPWLVQVGRTPFALCIMGLRTVIFISLCALCSYTCCTCCSAWRIIIVGHWRNMTVSLLYSYFCRSVRTIYAQP